MLFKFYRINQAVAAAAITTYRAIKTAADKDVFHFADCESETRDQRMGTN